MKSYSTLSEAVADLKKRGYFIDFNLGFNGVQCRKSGISLAHDKFEITEVYRFEGATDPGDEAIVYAIESADGHKGTLVNGYGISSDPVSEQMVSKLSIKHHQDQSPTTGISKA
jgi:hypothetical protein